MNFKPAYIATVLAAIALPGGRCLSQTPVPEFADTLRLSEVRVTGDSGQRRARVAADGSMSYGREALAAVPRVLGEADPLRFASSLPGVSVASDYASGMSVDGMSQAHNLFRLNGVPIHFPYHFGGIFSVFSPELYSAVSVRKSIKRAADSGVLGGIVDLCSGVPDSLSAKVNVGMLATSAYIAVPAGRGFSVEASGRVSYIDAIYSELLRSKSTQAKYNLADCDFAANWDVSSRDQLRLTAHYNADNVEYTDRNYSLTTALRWHNLASGLQWRRSTASLAMLGRLYFTSFHNRLELMMGRVRLDAPTGVDEAGGTMSFNFDELPRGWAIEAGYSLRAYRITPQYVEIEGLGQGGYPRRGASVSFEETANVEVSKRLPRGWRLVVGLPANIYLATDFTRFDPDLRFSLEKRWEKGALTLHAGRYHQYLHQVGFSELGMSSNFKIAASARVAPEECDVFAVAGNLSAGGGFFLSADIYYKLVRHQPEYLGAILDILSPGYLAENYILPTRGYNAGGSLSARFERGAWNAAVSYSYCLSRRRMDGEPYEFSASNELRHVLKTSASWNVTRHWRLSAAFNLTSGRPYTPVKAIYFIGEQLMMEYGHRNSARLPLYHRLDLGATYSFRTGGGFPLRHEVGLSVINAYGRRNVELATFALDADNGVFHRRNVSSLYRFLPSLNYTISF